MEPLQTDIRRDKGSLTMINKEDSGGEVRPEGGVKAKGKRRKARGKQSARCGFSFFFIPFAFCSEVAPSSQHRYGELISMRAVLRC